MKDSYPYFRDPRALEEIRKHKWIESQKQNQEVSFATAALDWINNYGAQWKEIHADESKDNRIFIEQRKYRRFRLTQLIKLVKDNITFLAEGINISFFGLTCRARKFLPVGSVMDVYVPIEQKSGEKIICRGTVERAIQVKLENYEVFLKFGPDCQRQIENCEYFRGQAAA
ncbi:MAG: hypothetical protein K9L86_06745 [Candidatus Omnitrophica bacterium]|nr:hypothetical protein [Candidatus Omnitrophota bacterium]